MSMSKELFITRLVAVAFICTTVVFAVFYINKPQSKTVYVQQKVEKEDILSQESARNKCLSLNGIPIIDGWSGLIEDCKFK